MKFSPIRFQGSLASAGVALMPFLYLQFSYPHGKGFIHLSDVVLVDIPLLDSFILWSLIGIMLVFTLLHLGLTLVFVKDLIIWLLNKEQVKSFLNAEMTNIGIFSPILSLSMTMNIILAPLSFFSPSLASMQQAMMPYAFLFWALLWSALLLLEAKVVKVWLTIPMEIDKLNFTWLLDSFAFGMVALVGSGIASTAQNQSLSNISAFMTWMVFFMGLLLLAIKVMVLILNQLKAHTLPEKTFLPATLSIVPIICLYGVSSFKLNTYLTNTFNYNMEMFSYLAIISSYVIATGYFLFCIYLIKDYFLREFIKHEFYPSQWGIVCALVGFEVLGAYVFGFYYKSNILLGANYIATLLAVVIYGIIFIRYLRASKAK